MYLVFQKRRYPEENFKYQKFKSQKSTYTAAIIRITTVHERPNFHQFLCQPPILFTGIFHTQIQKLWILQHLHQFHGPIIQITFARQCKRFQSSLFESPLNILYLQDGPREQISLELSSFGC